MLHINLYHIVKKNWRFLFFWNALTFQISFESFDKTSQIISRQTGLHQEKSSFITDMIESNDVKLFALVSSLSIKLLKSSPIVIGQRSFVTFPRRILNRNLSHVFNAKIRYNRLRYKFFEKLRLYLPYHTKLFQALWRNILCQLCPYLSASGIYFSLNHCTTKNCN